MKVYIFLIISIFILGTLEQNLCETCHNKTNTFLVKTKLSKEQLESLLKQDEVQLVNLGGVPENIENQNNTKTKPDGDDITTEEGLHREIQDEIRDDALLPLDEFKVKEIKQSETTKLVARSDGRFIDLLYEKRFGKIYIYLTLIFFFFILIRFTNLKGNDKLQYKQAQYVNYYDFDFSKESMITKSD